MLPVRLRFVCDLSDGLLLLPIECVRAGLVRLEVADELGVSSNRSSDDARDVLCKCAGIIGTDDGGIRHRLAGTEGADKKLFCDRSLRGEGERKGDSEWETLLNGYGNESRCRDGEYLGESDAPLARGTMKTRSERVARR